MSPTWPWHRLKTIGSLVAGGIALVVAPLLVLRRVAMDWISSRWMILTFQPTRAMLCRYSGVAHGLDFRGLPATSHNQDLKDRVNECRRSYQRMPEQDMIDSTDPCTHCGNDIPPSAERCPHCGLPGIFPNVRAADDAAERDALAARYDEAVQRASARGAGDVLRDFEEVAARSAAVISRPLG